MPRVKIKTASSKDPRKQQSLLEVLSKNDIFITKLIPLSDGYAVITNNEDDLDRIFNPITLDDLIKKDLHPLIPPELKANRSIIITNVDNYIYNNTEDQIKEEIHDKNPWATGGIDSVFRFPNSKIIKITFTQATLAKKSQATGIRCFHMSIPGHYIKQEIFYNITTCYKCYKIEDHFSNQCPAPKEYQICSECSSTDHTWKDCNSNQKKCINCEGEHRTLAAKCPIRKDVIKNKRLAQDKTTQITYSQATQKNTQNTTSNQSPNINNETHAKIFTCIIHAHLANIASPGSYEKELNSMLTLNNLPNIKAPSNPQSNKIISNVYNQEELNKEGNGEDEAEVDPMQEKTTTQEEVPNSQQQSRLSKKTHKIKATEIGLQIHTSTNTGWPKDILTRKKLIEGIEDKKYKITFTTTTLDSNRVLQAIEQDEIDLDQCWQMLEDSQFRKLRSGRIMERTPPPRLEKQRKNSR